MALSADTARSYQGVNNQPDEIDALPVTASVTIYVGSAVSIDSNGEVNPLQTDEVFWGFSMQQVTNGTTAGAVNCEIGTSGRVLLVITGLDDNNDIGDVVYATDDGTFTLDSSGGVAIGKVSSVENLTATKGWVRFKSGGHEHHLD